jgi:hypothetical protein
MLIGDKYKIESDELQYIIYSKRISGDKSKVVGEIIWKAEAYFKTLPEAIRYLVDREIRSTGFTDLEVVSDKIEELKRTLIKEYSKAL